MRKEYHINLEFKRTWKKKILIWYKINKRNLPWRFKNNINFYKVWISEVMLQQTQVSKVIPYFQKFINKWPKIDDFYKSSLDDILFLWQGLGYYQRAKNLFKAKEYLKKNKIKIVKTELIKLPGIGDYISSSIPAILNDDATVVVDGNIKRIIVRVFGLHKSNKHIERKIYEIASELTPKTKNGDYCQALMDLANIVCKPKNPECNKCPIERECIFQTSSQEFKINKIKKLPKRKFGVAFIIKFNNSFLMEISKEKLLQGLYGFPLSELHEFKSFKKQILAEEEIIKKWIVEKKISQNYKIISKINHKFTHFHLNLSIVQIELFYKKKN